MDDSTAQVFICYRRGDTGYVARGLGDRLNARFGRVFMDIDDIDPGENFTDVIRHAVAECDVLLALIGKNWVDAVDALGQRRLDDPNDWIVHEITTALQRGVWVIPVLVDDAKMPQPGDLPSEVRALTNRQAIRIRLESFDDDANRLMVSIRRALDSAENPTSVQRRIEADTVAGPNSPVADQDGPVTPARARLPEAQPSEHTRPSIGTATAHGSASTPGPPRRFRLLVAAGALVVIVVIGAAVFVATRSTKQSDAEGRLDVAVAQSADQSPAGAGAAGGSGGTSATSTTAAQGGAARLTNPTVFPTGHSGVVSSLAFRPNSTLLASAGHDSTVRLSDIADPTAVPVTFKGPTAAVNSIAFNPDGSRLASGGEDDKVIMWNVSNPQQPTILGTHQEGVTAVAFSHDGKTLASASKDDTIRLWDIATGQYTELKADNTGDVTGVAFSPDGVTLASSATDGKVRLWDVRAGKELNGSPLTRGDDNDSKMLCVAFSVDGATLAGGSDDNSVWIWDMPAPSAGRSLSGQAGGVDTVAFGDDDTTLVTGSWDGTVGLAALAGDSAAVTPFSAHQADVYGVAYGHVAEKVASTGKDGTVLLWDLAR